MCREGDSDELVAHTCGRAIPGMEVRIAETHDELLVRGDALGPALRKGVSPSAVARCRQVPRPANTRRGKRRGR